MTPQPARTRPRGALTCPASSSAGRSSRSSSRSSPCSAGLVAMRGLPIAQFPQIVPPQIIVTAQLPRRRRADHRAVGRDAARAADERRRQHALHAVDQRQRRHDDADRHVRRRHRPEHRPGQRPEPHGAGAAEPAARGQPVRPDDAQADRPADADRVALLAEAAPTTRCSSPTTRTSTSSTRSTACPASARSRIFGAGDYAMRIWVKPDLLARLGLTVPDLARADPAAEHGQSRRARSAPSPAPAGPGDDLHRPRAGAAADGGGVRRDRRALESRRLGRCACATSRASSSARSTTSRSAASTASRAARSRSSRRPARTRSRSPRASRRRWTELQHALSRRTSSTRYTLDTTRAGHRGHPRDR